MKKQMKLIRVQLKQTENSYQCECCVDNWQDTGNHCVTDEKIFEISARRVVSSVLVECSIQRERIAFASIDIVGKYSVSPQNERQRHWTGHFAVGFLGRRQHSEMTEGHNPSSTSISSSTFCIHNKSAIAHCVTCCWSSTLQKKNKNKN